MEPQPKILDTNDSIPMTLSDDSFMELHCKQDWKPAKPNRPPVLINIDIPFCKSELKEGYHQTISTPLDWPYCCIGILLIEYADKTIIHRVATLVESNLVITCKHFFTDKQVKASYFIAGYNKGKGKMISIRDFPPKEAKKINDIHAKTKDVCFLSLTQEVTIHEFGYLSLNMQPSIKKNQQVTGYGYCLDYYGEIKLYSVSRMRENIRLNQASQGGPIFSHKTGEWQVIGLFTGEYWGTKMAMLMLGSNGRPHYYLPKQNGLLMLTPSQQTYSYEKQGFQRKKVMKPMKTIKKQELDLKKNQIVRIKFQKKDSLKQDLCFLAKFEMKKLKIIDLSSCKIRDEVIFAIKCAKWKHVSELLLRWNLLGDQGIHSLIKCDFSELRKLDLSDNSGITDESVKSISQSNWYHLKLLNLQGSAITPIAFRYLLKFKIFALTIKVSMKYKKEHFINSIIKTIQKKQSQIVPKRSFSLDDTPFYNRYGGYDNYQDYQDYGYRGYYGNFRSQFDPDYIKYNEYGPGYYEDYSDDF